MITAPDSRAEVLTKLGKAVAQDQTKTAEMIFDEALAAIQLISCCEKRGQAWCNLAETVAAANSDRAKRVIDQALEAVNAIGNTHTRAHLLCQVASAAAQAGIDASPILDNAVDAAKANEVMSSDQELACRGNRGPVRVFHEK